MSGKFRFSRYYIFLFFLSFCFVNQSFGAVLFQDNFNYTDSFTNHGWSNVTSQSSIAVGAGPDGSNALKIAFTGGDINRGHDWVPGSNLNEVWLKFSYKLDCGSGSCKGGGKWLKIFGGNYWGSCPTNPNASLGTWGGSSYDGIFNVMQYGGTGSYSDACSDVGINIGVGVDNRNNGWHTFKLHARYNDNNTANGIYQVWHDGVQKVNVTNVINRGNSAPTYIGAIELGGWNQSYGGTPYYYLYDNFVVATTDPDSGSGSGSLLAPTGLKAAPK